MPINNIDSFYKMDTNYGLTYAYLQGKDGKIYTIQNPLVQLGNTKYNYTFKNIMSNVKQIAVTEGRIAYLTNDKKLYVAGNNKSVLGFGTNETSKQINPVEVIDTNISNRVKQVYMANNFYVLTDDNRLYGTGAAGTSGNISPGWSEQTSQTSFVEILSDVEGFYTVSNIKIAYNQEKVWIWYGGRTWGTSYNSEVWATGINASGIFGRWINTTPRYARTINQTAYVWVRCPVLEK